MLPPLTTVQMSCKELATAAVDALRAGIEPNHPKATQSEWQIDTRLVVRQSSTFPRGTLPAVVKRSSAKR
jgi:LacI family transcriptional regulator